MSATLDRDGVLRIDTRRRVVWTTDERRLLDKVARVFLVHGDRLLLLCGSDVCPDARIHLAVDASDPGGAQLVCGCSVRTFSPSC